MENKIKKFWNTSKSISHMMRTSKLLIDESLSWKKKSVPCFPEIVFRKHKICAGLDYCLTYLSHHPIKMFFSLLDNAPIYPTIGSWVCCPKEPISIFWSAVLQINCTVNCKTEVLTIGTSQTTTLERNEMHTLRILSRTHYTKVGMCMYIHCTRLRFLIR